MSACHRAWEEVVTCIISLAMLGVSVPGHDTRGRLGILVRDLDVGYGGCRTPTPTTMMTMMTTGPLVPTASRQDPRRHLSRCLEAPALALQAGQCRHCRGVVTDFDASTRRGGVQGAAGSVYRPQGGRFEVSGSLHWLGRTRNSKSGFEPVTD